MGRALVAVGDEIVRGRCTRTASSLIKMAAGPAAGLQLLAYMSTQLDAMDDTTATMSASLANFEVRLGELNTHLLPIHSQTQSLKTAHANIGQTLDATQEVISHYKTCSAHEAAIDGGLRGAAFGPFLLACDRVCESLAYLAGRGEAWPSAREVHSELHALHAKAMKQAEGEFCRLLSSAAPAATAPRLAAVVEGRADADAQALELLDEQARVMLQQLVRRLDRAEGRGYLLMYSTVREGAIASYLAPYRDARSTSLLRYQKGTHPILQHLRVAAAMFSAERRLAFSVLAEGAAGDAVRGAVGAEVAALERVAAELLQQVGALKADKSKTSVAALLQADLMFALTDCTEQMIALGESAREAFGGSALAAHLQAWLAVQQQLLAEAKAIFGGFSQQLGEASRVGDFTDGNVHEVTTTTASFLRRLLDYPETALTLLGTGQTLSTVFISVLGALLAALRAKAESGGARALGSIFLLNNVNYVALLLLPGTGPLADVAGSEQSEQLQALLREQREAFKLACWAAGRKLLTDPVQGKNPREVVKARFVGFDKEWGNLAAISRYSVPDSDLREVLRQDAIDFIVAPYTEFVLLYRFSGFSKPLEKYVSFETAGARRQEGACETVQDLQATLRKWYA